jgi:hypothetical protein
MRREEKQRGSFRGIILQLVGQLSEVLVRIIYLKMS